MQEQNNHLSTGDKARAFLKKNGFFVVAGLCALCAGIAALVTFLPGAGEKARVSPTPSPLVNAQLAPSATPAQAMTPSPEASVAPETASVNADLATPKPSEAPVATQKPKAKSKAPAPVDGEILFGYAVDTLLYSKTLDQWTTHEGVDIAARLTTPVSAIRGGTVENVYTDDALGVCVEIAHDGGLVSVYGNLTENPPVKKGDKVNEGDTVGLIGDTAVSECAMDPHLHFALKEKGESIDPHAHVLLGG